MHIPRHRQVNDQAEVSELLRNSGMDLDNPHHLFAALVARLKGTRSERMFSVMLQQMLTIPVPDAAPATGTGATTGSNAGTASATGTKAPASTGTGASGKEEKEFYDGVWMLLIKLVHITAGLRSMAEVRSLGDVVTALQRRGFKTTGTWAGAGAGTGAGSGAGAEGVEGERRVRELCGSSRSWTSTR